MLKLHLVLYLFIYLILILKACIWNDTSPLRKIFNYPNFTIFGQNWTIEYLIFKISFCAITTGKKDLTRVMRDGFPTVSYNFHKKRFQKKLMKFNDFLNFYFQKETF